MTQEIMRQTVAGQSSTPVQDAIRGKKLLLVLDDVRSLDEGILVSIRDSPLFVDLSSIKVLITTRSENITGSFKEITTSYHELGAVSDEDAWKLFENVAFSEDRDPELQDLGCDIVRKTNNVPRAVKDIASLLKGEDQRKWKAFMNADFSCLNEGYSPFTSASALTFHLLPSPLKRCFAYSALSQQNHNYEMQQLIHLWMAQGYIEEEPLNDEKRSLEEVADDYYKALQDWSFFKDPDSDSDLAKLVAPNEMLAVHFSCTRVGDVLAIDPHDCEGIYHVLISSTSSLPHNSGRPNIDSTSFLRQWIDSLSPLLRSLLKARGSTVRLTEPICDHLFSKLGHLRSLDLNSSNITVVPASIGMLDQLRYLNLSLNDFVRLPASITTIAKLHVLDLSSCKKLVILPAKLRRLSCLRHLYLAGCTKLTGMPRGLCKMTALLTLDLFVVGKTGKYCELDELSGLNLKPDIAYGFASTP